MIRLSDFGRAGTISAIISLPLFIASPASAQTPGDTSNDGLWTIFDGVTLPSDYSPPDEFAIARLATAAMSAVLATAPPENPSAPDDPVALFLPLPNGSFKEVGAQSSLLMERSLAAMDPFDDIATFRFDAFEGDPLGGHILTTPSMFDAVGYSDGNLLRIEPLETPDGLFHIIYFESDRTDGLNDFEHVTDESDLGREDLSALDPDFVPPIPPVPASEFGLETLQIEGFGPAAPEFKALAAAQPVDGLLRVFRFAATTTGEFYQANDNGGGDFDVVVSLILRLLAVNAVFEPEIGVRLTLAASTLNVLFDDPTTDPFLPNPTPCQFRDVQPFIALFFLPVATYDLGFLFATGGGGGCAWYVVCEDTGFEKSRGAGKFGNGMGLGTGLILHEVGHQLGARHTFSGTDCDTPNFDGDNATIPSAYAPGSGSTIMSYLNNCGPDDNVDVSLNPAGTYYNIKSIEQIADELSGGVGATCGATLDFGNSPPDVDAGSNYTIPRNTPFTLEALSASDPDGDPVSITWEQVDLTIVQRDIDEDAGNNPIIRSVPPTAFLDRTIPDIRDILGNLNLDGELLPQVNRSLNFRVTARDGQLAGGGVAYDAMTISALGAPFFITSPISGTLQAGCMVPVDWTIGGGDVAANVDISYSITGGLEDIPMPVRQSFPTNLVLGTANDGSHLITVPCELTSEARIKVKASDNIFFDVNDNDLTVANDPPVATIDPIADGEVDDMCEFTLEFTATVTDSCGVAAADVDVDVSKEPPGAYTLGVPSTAIEQNGVDQVDVTGSVLVSGLLASPAVVRIEVDAEDNCGATDSTFELVEVSDTTPPMISVSLDPDTLWPPNHKMVDITATVVATDNCPVSFVLYSVTSDEPDNDVADGATDNDIQGAEIGTPDLEFMLRAERAGTMDGRTYTVTYEAEDGSGNTASDSDTVVVQHDRAK